MREREKATDGNYRLSREGEFWTIVYAGTACHLRDTAGARQLACLLSRPDEKISARVLHQVGDGRSYEDASLEGQGTTEHARVNVTRALRLAMRRMEGHPSLLAHLQRTIRTGAYCSYLPDPRVPMRWQIAAGGRNSREGGAQPGYLRQE